MTSTTNSFKNWFSSKPEVEDFFRDFWPTVDKEVKKEKLEQELLSLKERERRRQYLLLATMIPFALFMATELEAVCSDQMLLGVISGVLSHTILPFTVLSLLCTLYLIYNNRKIAQKEQELENLENIGSEEEAKNVKYDFFNDAGQCLNYIEVAITTLTIIAGVIGEVSSFEAGGAEVAGDAIFFIANFVAFFIALASYIKQYNKHAAEEVKSPNPDEEHTKKTNSNMFVAGLTLAGSSIFLVRRIMLMLSTSSAIDHALGLAGIALFIIVQVLVIRAYSKELTDVKVSGKGASLGLGVNSNTRAGAGGGAAVGA
ncbi:hypothetical protein [Wolbachia endosymbiont (group E) of Neria commutata]|uniref:hypothetical protein n=1 Tax=Wolbachia endosymbiont (group E) of Neria commutata TaxID=3066149 RepID=UPI0031329D60